MARRGNGRGEQARRRSPFSFWQDVGDDAPAAMPTLPGQVPESGEAQVATHDARPEALPAGQLAAQSHVDAAGTEPDPGVDVTDEALADLISELPTVRIPVLSQRSATGRPRRRRTWREALWGATGTSPYLQTGAPVVATGPADARRDEADGPLAALWRAIQVEQLPKLAAGGAVLVLVLGLIGLGLAGILSHSSLPPAASPTVAVAPTVTLAPAPTATLAVTATPTHRPTPTHTPAPTVTATATASPTPATPAATATADPAPSPSGAPSP